MNQKKGVIIMFGKKKRIIETQKAIIADLKEENKMLIEKLQVISTHYEKLQSDYINKCQMLNYCRYHYGMNIDFPNSQKGGSTNTGAINVSDILQL